MSGQSPPGAWERRAPSALLFAGLVLPLGVCAALIPFRSAFPNAGAALIIVLAIIVVGLPGRRLPAISATFSAALWFDFFLTRPYERFTISRRSDIETTIALFVVGLVVTELSARRRRSHEVADAEADHLALIGTLSAMQAEGATPARVVDWAASALADLLDLTGCRFDPNPGVLPLPSVEEDGQVVWAGISWDVEQMGFPRGEAELPIRHRGRVLGRFVLTPRFRVPVGRERRMVAVILANLAGSSLLAQTKA